MGIGHHGEPGTRVESLKSAKEMALQMVDIIVPDLPFVRGDEVVVLLSGLGATPVMELYILYNEVDKILADRGIRVHRSYVGNYFTSLDMMGATLSLLRVDGELKELIDAGAVSAGLTQWGPR